MKKSWITLFLIAFAFIVNAQQLETVVNYYDIFKTKKLEEFTVKKGTFIKQGNYKKWDERGSLVEDYNFANNELHGVSKEYYSEGLAALIAGALQHNPEFYYRRLYRLAEYNNGIPKYEKIYKYIKEKQVLSKEELFDSQGELISSKEYYLDGKPDIIITREPDKINYAYSFYFPNGQLKEKQFMFLRNKELVQTGKHEAFYENGAKKIAGQYKDGKRVGEFKVYMPDGKLISESLYKEYKEGSIKYNHVEYYSNGKISYKSTFNESDEYVYAESYDSLTYDLAYKSKQPIDLTNGKWVKWYSDGSILSEREPDGKYTEYYKDGKVKIKGTYENIDNTQNGDFFYYDNNGLLVDKISYRNGKEYDRVSGEEIRAKEKEIERIAQEKAEKEKQKLEQKKLEEERITQENKIKESKMAEMRVMHEKISNNLKQAYINDEAIFKSIKIKGGAKQSGGMGAKQLFSTFDIVVLNDLHDVEAETDFFNFFRFYYMNAISLLREMELGVIKNITRPKKLHDAPNNVNDYEKMKQWLNSSEKLLKLSTNVKQAFESKDKKTMKKVEKEISAYKQYVDGQMNLINMYQ